MLVAGNTVVNGGGPENTLPTTRESSIARETRPLRALTWARSSNSAVTCCIPANRGGSAPVGGKPVMPNWILGCSVIVAAGPLRYGVLLTIVINIGISGPELNAVKLPPTELPQPTVGSAR